MRRPYIFSALTAAVLCAASPGAAFVQQGEPVYNTIYYDDAGHGNMVGSLRGSCTIQGVRYRLIGQRTNFSEEELIGYCVDGDLQPV